MRNGLRRLGVLPLLIAGLAAALVFSSGCYLPKGDVTTVSRVVEGRRLNSRVQRVGLPMVEGNVDWNTPGKLTVKLTQHRKGKVDQEYLAQNVTVVREKRVYYRETYKEGPVLTGLWFLMEVVGSIGSYGIWDAYTITRLAWGEAPDDEAYGLIGGPVEYFTKVIISKRTRKDAIKSIKNGQNRYVSPRKNGLYGIYLADIGHTTASVTPNQTVDEIVSLTNATLRFEPVDDIRPIYRAKTDKTGTAVFHLSDDIQKLRQLVPGTYTITLVEDGVLYPLREVDITLSHIAKLLQASREAMNPENDDADNDDEENENDD